MIPGIIQINLIPDGHGGTGVYSLIIIALFLVRKQTDSQVLPGHQILGHDMIPMLQAVNRAPGTPLIEQMPAVVKPHEAVGVVHESGHRLIMKCLAVTGASDPVIQSHQLLGILQVSVFFFSCPFFQTPCPPFSDISITSRYGTLHVQDLKDPNI